jgi:hypothetical protein
MMNLQLTRCPLSDIIHRIALLAGFNCGDYVVDRETHGRAATS